MKTSQYGDYLIQLTRLYAFNCFLVREGEGLTLVDTGLSGSAKGILAAAGTLGKPIQRIVLTHAHSDHAGSLAALSQALPGVEIAMTERMAQFLAGNLALLPDEPQAKLKGNFVRVDVLPTLTLAPGDQVGSLRVVAAPGHTPDHITFFDERDGTLIAGDAFQTRGGVAVAGVIRWRFPFPGMASWHKPTAVTTARTLRGLEPSRMAVGHGPVLEKPGRAMDEAIREAEEKMGG